MNENENIMRVREQGTMVWLFPVSYDEQDEQGDMEYRW